MLYNLKTVALLWAVIGGSLVVASDSDIQAPIVTSAIPGAYIVELADAVVSIPLKLPIIRLMLL